MTEFAALLPFFLVFVMAVFEYSIAFVARSATEQGVFSYSRWLAQQTAMQKSAVYDKGVADGIFRFFSPFLIERLHYEIGPVTPTTDFSKPLTTNTVVDYFKDANRLVYIRVVAERRKYTFRLLKMPWDFLGDPMQGGLFAPIDVLVVVPLPPLDQS